MQDRKIIVVGGSAGSGKALREILSALPADLNAAIFVAVHRSLVSGIDYLPLSLEHSCKLQTGLAYDGQLIETGRLYISPAERHLLVHRYAVRIETSASGPSRDSIDALFRSAAHSHPNCVIGVLLSGTLSDGTSGFWEIRKSDGITITQDPQEAQYSSMPQNAMKDVPVDYCLPASEISCKLEELVKTPALPRTSGNGRIMIVEDEWLIASDLKAQLNDLGYEVVGMASSAEEALSLAAQNTPDVAIMDIHLGGRMKGTEAAKRLHDEFRIPSIFLTSYTDTATFTAAQTSQPFAFLAKPHHGTELYIAIQLALKARQSALRG